jgi:O-antigen ligase
MKKSPRRRDELIVGQEWEAASVQRAPRSRGHRRRNKLLTGVHIGLALFFVVSFGRAEDWTRGLSVLPLGKITATLVVVAFLFSIREIRWPLPREAVYLILLVLQLFATVPMSLVWPGGAFHKTLEFSKVVLIVVVFISVVTTFRLLSRFLFIQAASVAAVAVVTLWHGQMRYQRLQSVLGGDYADPNSLALAIIVSLPLCLALMFLSRNRVRKAIWALAMLPMLYVIFLTGSRSGFVSFVVTAGVCLWEFSIRGHRRYLLPVAGLLSLIALSLAGGTLVNRLSSTFTWNKGQASESAYGSAQERQELLWRSLVVTAQHPLFGVGPGNFEVISGNWHVTHNSFTEMSAEGGLPAFILYVLILWKGFRNLKLVKRLGRRQARLRLMAKALRASLVGYVVGAAFASTAYEYLPYFLVAYTTALLWIARNSVSPAQEAKPEIPPGTETDLYALNGGIALPLAAEPSHF